MNNQSPIKTLATLIRKTLVYNLEKSFYNNIIIIDNTEDYHDYYESYKMIRNLKN